LNDRHIMRQPVSIIAELEDALKSGSSAKRVATLRQVTDLFLCDGEQLSEDQIKVFDDVLCHLIVRVETRIRAEIGAQLASVAYAPRRLIEHLAWDDQIAVAGSVLASSPRLTTDTLVEIARARGPDHLLAISGRTDLPEAVSDVVLDRGESNVIRKLASNPSARFSDAGYSGMVGHAEADDDFTEILGLRIDLPRKFLRDLLLRASEAVRARLTASAPAELREDINRLLKTIMSKARKAKDPPIRNFSRAEAVVKRMKGMNELNDAAIIRFVEARKFAKVAASLAILNNSAPTDMMARLLVGVRADLILIPCKSAGLGWPAVEMILRHRSRHGIDDATLELALKDYSKLSVQTAERTVRFWQLHDKVE
jgi:Uncharacterised protein conserved in bacteria (DUF2336)